jgi:DNA transformation protein and related proteins
MPERNSELSQLRNIGPTIEQRLREVQINTRRELEAIGPVEAFRRIKEKHPDRTIPVCYYLYSFQGALLDVHWEALPEDMKALLRREAGVEDERGRRR